MLTEPGTAALMCAEIVPWRRNRSLAADALIARVIHAEHITRVSRSTPPHLAPFAKREGSRVRYPVEAVGSSNLLSRARFHLETSVRVLQRRPAKPVEV